jgi:hypothetical protein
VIEREEKEEILKGRDLSKVERAHHPSAVRAAYHAEDVTLGALESDEFHGELVAMH